MTASVPAASGWLVFGDIATAVAAVAAAVGLLYARASSRASRDAVTVARDTVRLAEAARKSAERDRLRHQVEHVGALVQAVLWGAEGAIAGRTPQATWMEPRNRLQAAMAGLEDRLPKCAEVAYKTGSPTEASQKAGVAWPEVEQALRDLVGP